MALPTPLHPRTTWRRMSLVPHPAWPAGNLRDMRFASSSGPMRGGSIPQGSLSSNQSWSHTGWGLPHGPHGGSPERAATAESGMTPPLLGMSSGSQAGSTTHAGRGALHQLQAPALPVNAPHGGVLR